MTAGSLAEFAAVVILAATAGWLLGRPRPEPHRSERLPNLPEPPYVMRHPKGRR